MESFPEVFLDDVLNNRVSLEKSVVVAERAFGIFPSAYYTSLVDAISIRSKIEEKEVSINDYPVVLFDDSLDAVNLGCLALESVVADDVVMLFYLLVQRKVSVDFTYELQNHGKFPFLKKGDTISILVKRFNSLLCARLLSLRKEAALSQEMEMRKRRAALMSPNRRGSYMIFRGELKQLKKAMSDEDLMLVSVHFSKELGPKAPSVTIYKAAHTKKARHLVYELGEKFGVDLEAFGLKNSNGEFLDDYKSLSANNVRSGDELFVVLKHRALHSQKNYICRLTISKSDGSMEFFSCALDPFLRIGRFLQFLKIRRSNTCPLPENCELFLPLIHKSNLGGIWLDFNRTFASYGLSDQYWSVDGFVKQKPLWLCRRSFLGKFKIDGIKEQDPRIGRWLDVLAGTKPNNSDALKKLIFEGCPSCLRGKLWDFVLNYNDFSRQNMGLFERLVDQELITNDEESMVEKIERDLDRTMPYHPFFREKGGIGQRLLFEVLRAYSLYDKEVGYVQGMNFVCANILTVTSRADLTFYILVLLMNNYGIRSSYTHGMKGLHKMLNVFDSLLIKHLPALHEFMLDHSIITASFATEWFLTIYSSHNEALVLFDAVLIKGANFLYNIALATMSLRSQDMMRDPDNAMETLKKSGPGARALLEKAVTFNL